MRWHKVAELLGPQAGVMRWVVKPLVGHHHVAAALVAHPPVSGVRAGEDHIHTVIGRGLERKAFGGRPVLAVPRYDDHARSSQQRWLAVDIEVSDVTDIVSLALQETD